MTRSRLLLLAMVVTAVGRPARADEPLAADGSPLPPNAQLALMRDRDGGLARVWYAHQGGKPRVKPGPGGASNPEADQARPLRFMTPLYYTREAIANGPDGPARYLLLVEGNNQGTTSRVVGWVDERHVVRGQSALFDEASKIYRKAMIVNTVESVVRDGQIRLVQPKLGPEGGAPAGSLEIQLFRIFFVFAETRDSVLIGTRPEFVVDAELKDPVRVVLGWVPRDRVCPWNSREAFYWAEAAPGRPQRTTPGKIYRNPDDALGALEGRTVDPLFVEDPDPDGNLGRPLRNDEPRYPILGFPSGSEVPQQVRGNRLERVGAFGPFRDEQGQVVFQQEEVVDIQATLKAIEEQISRVEILFVIDETQSMRRHFPVVARAIRQIIEGTPPGARARLRVAVSFYGDTFLNQAAATPKPLVSATDEANVDRLIADVEGHQAQEGSRGQQSDDDLERVFFGLGKAMQAAQFSRYSRKIVILLGDCGNKAVRGDPSLEGLAQLLRVPPPADPRDPGGVVPAEFYAIQVCKPDYAPATVAFQTEMKALAARVKALGSGDPLAGSLSEYRTLTDLGAIVESILERHRKLQEQADTLRDTLVRYGINPGGTVVGPELEKIFREYGVPMDELKRPGFQVFEYGYVWRDNERDRKPQFETWLLINDGELYDFLNRSSGLKKVRGQAGAQSIMDFLKQLIDEMAGDPAFANAPRPRSFAEALTKVTGLPIKSDLLNEFVDDAGQLRPTRGVDESKLELVKKKLSVLQAIRDGVRFDYTERPVNVGGVEIVYWDKDLSSRREEPRAFTFEGGLGNPAGGPAGGGEAGQIIWYYIRLDEEWP